MNPTQITPEAAERRKHQLESIALNEYDARLCHDRTDTPLTPANLTPNAVFAQERIHQRAGAAARALSRITWVLARIEDPLGYRVGR